MTPDERRRIAEWLATESAIAKATGRDAAARALSNAAGGIVRGRDAGLPARRAVLSRLAQERAAERGGRPPGANSPDDRPVRP